MGIDIDKINESGYLGKKDSLAFVAKTFFGTVKDNNFDKENKK